MRVAGDGTPRYEEFLNLIKPRRVAVPVQRRHQLMYRTRPSSGPSRIEKRYVDPSFGGSGSGVKGKKFRDKIVRGGPDLTEKHMAQTASTGGNKVGPDPAPTSSKRIAPKATINSPYQNGIAVLKLRQQQQAKQQAQLKQGRQQMVRVGGPSPDPEPAKTPGQLAYQRKQLVYRAMARAKMGNGGAATDARLRGGQKYKLGGS